MRQLAALIARAAPADSTVLIRGESGTGKELVAEALHTGGERSRKPLVKVNCSALPESLLESELFGHVKGAFTGALHERVGRFQKAHGGTIFLDEVGDLSPRIQGELLRVLQEREFERVGDSTTVHVDVRVIAATNRSLRDMVRRGEFREDLYYRLKVVEIHMPPLRERREDIPLLVDHFRRKYRTVFDKTIEAVSQDVMKVFLEYPWPGNVRELEHTMEHAFILCPNRTITLDHLPPDLTGPAGPSDCGVKPPGNADLKTLLDALERAGWNKAKAARSLGINRATLYRRMQRCNIKGDPTQD
jgi:transcriptional regulator with PAS, ATPase and Fis domain